MKKLIFLIQTIISFQISAFTIEQVEDYYRKFNISLINDLDFCGLLKVTEEQTHFIIKSECSYDIYSQGLIEYCTYTDKQNKESELGDFSRIRKECYDEDNF